MSDLEVLIGELQTRLQDHMPRMHDTLLSFVARVDYPIVSLLLEMIEKTFIVFGKGRTKEGIVLSTKSALFYYRLEHDFPQIFEKIQSGDI